MDNIIQEAINDMKQADVLREQASVLDYNARKKLESFHSLTSPKGVIKVDENADPAVRAMITRKLNRIDKIK